MSGYREYIFSAAAFAVLSVACGGSPDARISSSSSALAATGTIGDPDYNGQSSTPGAPLVSPWSGEGPDGIGVDTTNGYGGDNPCAFIYSSGESAWSDVVQTISVAPNTTYTLAAYVQTSSSFPGGSLGVRTSSGTTIQSQSYGTMTSYGPVSTTFNSGSDDTVVIFAGFANSTNGSAWIHVDSWSLQSDGGSGGGSSGSSVTVNENNACAIYSIGSSDQDWTVGDNSVLYDGDEYYTNFPNASVSINFTGTGIVWTGETGTNFGISSYAIDGATATNFDGYSIANTNQPNVTISGLASGSHVLQIQTTGTKDAASSNYFLTTDSFTITGSPLPPSSGTVGGYETVSRSGSGWTCGADWDDLSGGHCWSGTAGDSISWSFTGSLIEMYGRPDLGDGYFNVYIDGAEVATVDGWLPSITVDNDGLTAYMEFARKLSSGTHTIELVVTGTHNSGAKGENGGANNLLQFDEFIAFP